MASRPEYIILTAGGVTLAAGFKREGHFPTVGYNSIVATLILVLVVSVLANTKAAPIVTGLSYLFLLGAIFGAAASWNAKPQTTTRKK